MFFCVSFGLLGGGSLDGLEGGSVLVSSGSSLECRVLGMDGRRQASRRAVVEERREFGLLT